MPYFAPLLLIVWMMLGTPLALGKDRVVLQYWDKWTGIEAEAMRKVVEQYNASQSEVEVRYLSVSQIERKLMLAIAGGNPPDLAGIYSHVLSIYAENNALLPLDGLLKETDIREENYIPVYWEAVRHRGFTWGLPTTPSTVALYWNKAIFREAGLDPEKPPTSLAELEAINDALLIKEADGRIVRIGHTPQEPGWWNPLWVYWFGGRLDEAPDRPVVDTPAVRATFDWLQSYPKRFGGQALQALRNGFGNFASPQNSFFTGRVAMTLQGPWLFNFIAQYAPKDFEWGVAPFPSFDPKKFPNVTIAECDVLVIPKGSKHVKEAFHFLQYVSSQAVLEKLCLGQRKFSPLREVSPDFYKRHPNPRIKVFVDLAWSPNALLAPRQILWPQIKSALSVAIDQELLKGEDPALLLEPIEQRLDRIRKRQEARWERISQARLEEWQHLAEGVR
jgi:multiple sugar transport system substrate-binding protein